MTERLIFFAVFLNDWACEADTSGFPSVSEVRRLWTLSCQALPTHIDTNFLVLRYENATEGQGEIIARFFAGVTMWPTSLDRLPRMSARLVTKSPMLQLMTNSTSLGKE